jgi:putative hydrolase of the HAD superfamily
MQANIQYRKLTLLGIGNRFDCIVTSESVGHEKPNPLIFFHTLALMKGTPQKTFMVGDSLQNDIEPAAFIGIKPIWFNPRNKRSFLSETVTYKTITKYSQLLSKIAIE